MESRGNNSSKVKLNIKVTKSLSKLTDDIKLVINYINVKRYLQGSLPVNIIWLSKKWIAVMQNQTTFRIIGPALTLLTEMLYSTI